MFSFKELLKVIAAIIFPNIGSIWGRRIVANNLDPWFHSLSQPWWNPPDWIFAPVWVAIYCSIGIASYLVYREVSVSIEGWDREAQSALFLYLIQLAFNWAWVPIFFGLHSLKWVSFDRVNVCGFQSGRFLLRVLFIKSTSISQFMKSVSIRIPEFHRGYRIIGFGCPLWHCILSHSSSGWLHFCAIRCLAHLCLMPELRTLCAKYVIGEGCQHNVQHFLLFCSSFKAFIHFMFNL